MKALLELSQALAAIAELPEAVQKARQEQYGNLQTIEATIETLSRKITELGQTKETTLERVTRQGFISVNDSDGPGGSIANRYNWCVRFLLDNFGFDQWQFPHVMPDSLPTGSGIYRAQQVCMPGIYFPPGHYDWTETMWLHPCIEVFGAGQWATRFWFCEGSYADDMGRWTDLHEYKVAGPISGLPVCIGIPCTVKHANGQEWGSFNTALRNINCKFMVPGGQVGIGIYGVPTNLRLENLHLVADTGRDVSIAINHVPQSKLRSLPWGATAEPYGNSTAGYVTKCLDASFKDIMIEFFKKGIQVTGMGMHITGLRTYYTLLGAHIYGTEPGNDELILEMTHNEHGLMDRAKESLAAIVSHPSGNQVINVSSVSPVWSGAPFALLTKGGFKQGEALW